MNKPNEVKQKPLIPLSKVPSVGELCELLGFQSASIKETEKFVDTTRAWRKSYKPASNMTKNDLLRWNEVAVQAELKVMAEKFLGNAENGQRFWGTGRTWLCEEIQFPEDDEKIVNLLMQLFWKQNKYAFNNSQYNYKQTDLRDGSDTTTPSQETFRDSRSSEQPGTSRDAGTPEYSAPALAQTSDNPETTTNAKPAQGNGTSLPRDIDIFDGPNEEDEGIRDALEFLSAKDSTTTKSRNAPTPKDNNPRKRKKYGLKDPRRSDRKRVPPHRPDIIPDEIVQELFERDSSVEIMSPPTTFTTSNHPPATVIPIARMPFTAPTAPMISPKKSKPPISTSKISGPQYRRPPKYHRPEKAQSTVEKGGNKSPRQDHLPGSKMILKLNLPSAKIQSDVAKDATYRNPPSSPLSSLSPDGNNGTQYRAPYMESESPQGWPGSDRSKSPPNTSTFSEEIRIPGLDTIGTGTRWIKRGVRVPTPTPVLAKLTAVAHLKDQNANVPSQTEQVKKTLGAQAPQQYSSIPGDWMALDTPARNPQNEDMIEKPATVSEPIESTHKLSTIPQTTPTPPRQRPEYEPPLPQQARSQAPRPASARPKTQIPLWIITRSPRYTEERWEQGKFTGTSLSAFISGISQRTNRTHIEEIKLTLRTPVSDTKITVSSGAEESWVGDREVFVEKLREERGSYKLGAAKILVEPVYLDGPKGAMEGWGEEKDDDDDFEL